jgi:hypothetical protein
MKTQVRKKELREKTHDIKREKEKEEKNSTG